jgi:ZIP family zinc transporter
MSFGSNSVAHVDVSVILFWAGITFVAPLVLAVVPLVKRRISDRMLHLMLGFSAGLLLAIVFMEILPEAFELGETLVVPQSAISLAISGGPGHVHKTTEGQSIEPMGTLALGALMVHGVLDGFVIPLSFSASVEVGVVVAVAVALHQIPDSIAALSVALGTGRRGRQASGFVILTALDTPIGVALGLIFLGAGDWLVPIGLGFSAGTFTYISAADLIPELQHRSRSYVVILAILAGIAVVALITTLLPV